MVVMHFRADFVQTEGRGGCDSVMHFRVDCKDGMHNEDVVRRYV